MASLAVGPRRKQKKWGLLVRNGHCTPMPEVQSHQAQEEDPAPEGLEEEVKQIFQKHERGASSSLRH